MAADAQQLAERLAANVRFRQRGDEIGLYEAYEFITDSIREILSDGELTGDDAPLIIEAVQEAHRQLRPVINYPGPDAIWDRAVEDVGIPMIVHMTFRWLRIPTDDINQ